MTLPLAPHPVCVARAVKWLERGLAGYALKELTGEPPRQRYPIEDHAAPLLKTANQFIPDEMETRAKIRQAVDSLRSGRTDDARLILSALVEPAPRYGTAS